MQTQQSFGSRLRSQREVSALTLADVAKQTKISPRALECLERGLFADLPGDVFVRGFLRSYARCVGLNPEETVRDYGELMMAQEDASSAPPEPVIDEPETDPAAASDEEPGAPAPVTIKSITQAIVAAGDGTNRMPLKIAIAVLAVVATIAMALLMLPPS